MKYTKKSLITSHAQARPYSIAALLFALTLIFLPAASRAANDVWNGGNAPDFNWNTNNNWGGIAPIAGDSLFFNGSVGLLNTNNFIGNTPFAGITFNSGAGIFTLNGNALTLVSGGGITNNSVSAETNRLSFGVTNNNIVNYIVTPGGGPLVFPTGIQGGNWASGAVTNDVLIINSANLILGAQLSVGNSAGCLSNAVAIYSSAVNATGQRIATGAGNAQAIVLDNTTATFADSIIGNSGTAINGLLVITNGSILTIVPTSFNEVGRNTGSTGSKVIVTGSGSAWLNRGTKSFTLGGTSGTTTNAMVEVDNGALWDLGGSTFRLDNNNANNCSITANGGIITNVYSFILGNGKNSNFILLTNGGKFYDSSSISDLREIGRGSANFNTFTITGPGSLWNCGGATYTVGGTSANANNYSNILSIANGGTFTNGNLTVGTVGANEQIIISNAAAYITALVINGAGAVYLNGGSADTLFADSLGGGITGVLTNTATTPLQLNLGWNNGGYTGTTPPLISGLINIVKTGTGSQSLANANTFIGNVIVAGGSINSGLQQAASDASFSAFGCLTNLGKVLIITNGGSITLGNIYALLPQTAVTPGSLPSITIYAGSTLNSTRFNALGQITLNGGALVENSTDVGALNGYQFYTNVSVGGSAPSTISATNGVPDDLYNASAGGTTFNVANTASGGADLTVSAGLADYSNNGSAASAGSLIKTGAGIMLTTGTNIYTGSTVVQNGTLGIYSYSLQSGGITVNDGAILNITASGTGQIVPSTLTFGNSTGASLQFVNLSSTTTAPIIATNLTLNGTSTISFVFPTIISGNQYPLITYTVIGGSGGFVLSGGRPGSSMNLVTNNNGNGTFTILLNVVSTGSATTDIWTGVNSGNWNFTTANWNVGGSAGTYFDGDATIFTNGTIVTNVTIAATVTPGSLNVNGSNNYTFLSSGGGHIAGTGGLNKSGSGTLTLTGLVNTYSGTNIITGGTVVIDSNTNLGVGANNNIVLDGGALSAIANLTFGANRTINLGAGAINVATNMTVTISGLVANNGAESGSLTKTGAGTLSLAAANTYSGSTFVSSGKLVVASSQQSGGAFTVGDNAALTVNVSGGVPMPVSTLTLGSSGNTSLTLQNVSGTNSAIMATNLIANGVVTVIINGGSTKVGEIPLVQYSTLVGSVGNFALSPTLPPNVAAVLTNDTSIKSIALLITGLNGLTWSGANGSSWDIGTTTNWLFGTTNTVYSDGSPVLFSGGSGSVTVNQSVAPASVTVSNSSINFTFTPANGAGIGGSGGLNKQGPGTMTLNIITNSYQGNTVIGNGSVSISAHAQNANGATLLEFSTNSVIITNNAFLSLIGVGGSGTAWPQFMANVMTLDGGNIFAQDGGQHLTGPITIGPNGAGLGQQQANKLLFVDGAVSGSGAISAPLATVGGLSDGIHTPGGSGYSGPVFTCSTNSYNGTISLYNCSIGIQDPAGTAMQNAVVNIVGLNTNVNNVLDPSGYISPIIWTSNTTYVVTLGGLAGTAQLNIDANLGVALVLGNNRSDTSLYSGILSGGAISADTVTKVGSGIQWLVGSNNYTSATIINSGELGISTLHAGNGSFMVANNAGFGVTNIILTVTNGTSTNYVGTSAQIGSLTLGGGGLTTFEFQNVTNTGVPLITCSGGLTVSGSSTIEITGTNGLVAGNVYPLISASGGINGGGNFTLAVAAPIIANLVTNGGNTLALNVTSTGSSVNTNPTNIVTTVAGGNLTLTWPTDHTGWRLQVQTNSLNVGISTNWYTVDNSTNVNNVTVPINSANGSVFYRLVYP